MSLLEGTSRVALALHYARCGTPLGVIDRQRVRGGERTGRHANTKRHTNKQTHRHTETQASTHTHTHTHTEIKFRQALL